MKDTKYLLVVKINLIILFFSFLIADAQQLTITPSQLNFGVVNEITPDSQQVTITNNSLYTVTVKGYRFYNIYGQPAFSTNAGNPSIPAGGSQSIWIRFQPRHNIFHNTELFILNDGDEGALRVDLLGQGHYSKSYYDHTENLSEQVLKDTLHDLLGRNYFNAGYVVARDSMFMSYDNEKVNGAGAAVNTIECVYTGRKAVGYIDRTDCQTSFAFNTEHTFPQGFFNSLEPMRADLFHLYPTDDVANNVRGSLPFGVVSNPSWTQGGSKCDNVTFEPRDVHKGNVARAMLYFVIRYQNYNNFLDSQEGILRQWHQQYPPGNVEKTRLEKIAQLQLNRNPFIDYPQLAERIVSFSTTSTATIAALKDFPEDTIDFGLVDASLPHTYTFWISNPGNAPLSCSNLVLNPSSVLSFTNGSGGPLTIAPGESAPVYVQIANANPGNLGTASLSFNLSGTGLLTVANIPIIARLSLTSLDENDFSNYYNLFPNPATDMICLSADQKQEISEYRILDLQGRILAQHSLTGINCFDISTLPAGAYFFQGLGHAGVWQKRWIKN